MFNLQEIQRAGFEEVLRQISAVVIIAEAPSGKIIFSNREAQEVVQQRLGRPVPSELGGFHDLRDRDDFELFHLDGRPYEPEEWPLTRCIGTGEEVRDEEYFYTLADGTRFWLSSDCSPIYDDEGRIVAGVAIAHDITEQKRAEEECKEAHSRVESILESITDEFFAVDRQWRFTYINERALNRLRRTRGEGLTREELLGKNCWEAFPELVDTTFYHKYHEALREQKTVQFETGSPLISKTWYEVHAYPSEERLSVYACDITERKQAEEVRARLAAIVESSEDAIIGKTLDGIITNWNRGAQKIYGYSSEEVVGKPINILVPPDRPDEIPKLLERLRRGEVIEHYETVRVTKDGRRLDISLTVSPIRDSSGNIVGASKIARDITERKEVEEALRYQLSLTEAITDKAADPMLMLDAQGSITFANPAAEQMFGWRREELLGEVFHDKVHHHYPDGRPYPRSECPIMHALAKQRTLRDHEDLFFRKDGSTVDVSCSYAPFLVGGEVAGAVLVVRDITDRKQAQKEIEKRTHQQAVVADFGLRALANDDLQLLMDEAVVLVARTLEAEYSEVVRILSGEEELLIVAGVGWEEGVVGNTVVSAGFGSQAGYALISEVPVIVEDLATETRFDPPSVLVEHGAVSGMSVVIHGQQRPFGVICADTTSRRTFTQDDVNFMQAVANVLAAAIERKEAEEKLRGVREAERRRMARDLHDEALRDLTYALVEAQQVRSISKDAELNCRIGRLIAALDRIGPQLRASIYDLRLEGEQDRAFSELLESLVELQRGMAPDLDIHLEIQDGVLDGTLGEMDRELVRIVGEALTNARRHSGARNVRVSVGISEDEKLLWAEVSDDGRGFDRSQESPTATGEMGIKGMRERARVLGGDLKIEGEPGSGTKVRFELALKEERHEEPEEEVHVLLIEDHATLREALVSAFEREVGFEIVGQAGSLAEARLVFEETHPVDVVVVDLGLPDGYGGDLIPELHALNPQAQALVLSANLDRSGMARAVEAGAAGILHKTAHLDEVVEAVRRLRRGETLLPLEEVVQLLRFAGSERQQEHEARQAIEKLTPREREVLRALADGLDGQGIAERLNIALRTQRNHMSSILAKLGVHSQLQALVFALRHGVVEIP